MSQLCSSWTGYMTWGSYAAGVSTGPVSPSDTPCSATFLETRVLVANQSAVQGRVPPAHPRRRGRRDGLCPVRADDRDVL